MQASQETFDGRRNLYSAHGGHQGQHAQSTPVVMHSTFSPPMQHSEEKGQPLHPSRLIYRDDRAFVPISKDMFLSAGLWVLLLVCLLPCWDCAVLLLSPTFGLFGNRQLPLVVLGAAAGVLLVFYMATVMLVGRQDSAQRAGQTMTVISSLSLTLLGLVLVLVSLPLSRDAMSTHSSIMYQCGNSLETRELHHRYMELVKLRLSPACATKFSVEKCEGFEDEPTYTPFLRVMEDTFRCSGFCYRTSGLHLAAQANTSIAASHEVPHPLALLQKSRRRGTARVRLAMLAGRGTGARHVAHGSLGGPVYPPTLFSDANFRSSCDGAAARNVLDTALVTSAQFWYTGVLLITLSLCMGVWEWSCRLQQ